MTGGAGADRGAARDGGFRRRKREDHALALIEELEPPCDAGWRLLVPLLADLAGARPPAAGRGDAGVRPVGGFVLRHVVVMARA